MDAVKERIIATNKPSLEEVLIAHDRNNHAIGWATRLMREKYDITQPLVLTENDPEYHAAEILARAGLLNRQVNSSIGTQGKTLIQYYTTSRGENYCGISG